MVSTPAPSGSVFLVNRSTIIRAVFGKRVMRSSVLRPSRHWRDQKTFSAGPRSFSSKEVWVPGNPSQVQPVSDSRHGRIACKVSLSCTLLNPKRAATSNQSTGLLVQPLSWLAAALKIQRCFIALVANSGNIRFPS